MNFEKYHVSRNLLDYTTVENTSYATATLISGGITISGQYYVRFSSVSFTVGRSYTMSWTEKSISGTVKIMWRFQYLDGTYSVMPSSGMSLIAEKEVSALLLYVNGSSTESGVAEITNIMLNEGSTPLPYEPYSSEVWHDTPHYVHKTDTDTITTLPAVIYPNAATATVGLKGNAQQNGTPTPQNPVMPQGCGERTGNLFDMSFYEGKSGITVSGNKASGTCSSFFAAKISIPSELVGKTLTWSVYIKRNGSTSWLRLQTVDEGRYDIGTNVTGEGVSTVTFTATATKQLYINYTDTGTDGIEVSNIMIVEGSTAPSTYIPYGYKLDISSASTTTPVYLGEVETTRRIKKFVLTGNDGGVWVKNTTSILNGNAFFNPDIFTGYKTGMLDGYCSHYPTATATTDTIGIYYGININFITDFSEGIDTPEKWSDYLQQQYAAGTPVTVWYVLAEPETVVVNEPLMKIGDYSDEVSNVSIPVTAGGDTISVETTVQPSEVTVNYKGWHPVQSAHEKSRNLMVFNTDSPIGSVNFNVTPEKDTAQFVINKIQTGSAQSCTVPLSIPLKKGTYTLSVIGIINRDGSYDRIYIRDEEGVIVNYVQEGSPKTFTLANDTTITALSIPCGASSTYDNITVKVMLNEGSTALPYEPYWN